MASGIAARLARRGALRKQATSSPWIDRFPGARASRSLGSFPVRPSALASPDRFAIEGRAGGGGMGDVYRAVDRETGRLVAVKLLRATAPRVEQLRFAREIKVIAELRHPNIVEYVAHGTWADGRMFYAMEWLDGEDLSQRQRRAPLGLREAVEVVRRSAAAMAAIHARGVVHRDLKLANIFLVRGKGTQIKLIDFGVVKLPPPGDPMGLAPPEGFEDEPDERGAIIGTPHFMAPEQARGEPVDRRCDIYAFGALIYRLVTGVPAVVPRDLPVMLQEVSYRMPAQPSHVAPGIPRGVEAVLAIALAKAPSDRFASAGELAKAFSTASAGKLDPALVARADRLLAVTPWGRWIDGR
jgi:serine/threonine protein kinase